MTTLSSPEPRDMNFKVPLEFHRSFKAAAAYLGISMKDLLSLSFDYFLEHPDNKVIRDLLKIKVNAKKLRSPPRT
jgi:hypothetical protein